MNPPRKQRLETETLPPRGSAVDTAPPPALRVRQKVKRPHIGTAFAWRQRAWQSRQQLQMIVSLSCHCAWFGQSCGSVPALASTIQVTVNFSSRNQHASEPGKFSQHLSANQPADRFRADTQFGCGSLRRVSGIRLWLLHSYSYFHEATGDDPPRFPGCSGYTECSYHGHVQAGEEKQNID